MLPLGAKVYYPFANRLQTFEVAEIYEDQVILILPTTVVNNHNPGYYVWEEELVVTD
jgi:hypothetical protein